MKNRKSVPTRKSAQRDGSKDRAALVARIRALVVGAMEPQALLRLVWDLDGDGANAIDIDALVDEFARTHEADGYRDPQLQKRALDAIQEAIGAALPESAYGQFNYFATAWYSRYLLAADVGFEMGFAAAKALSDVRGPKGGAR